MGRLDVSHELDANKLRLFEKCLLKDVRALEHMIANGMFESEVRRIGAEQELFIVDSTWRPAPLAMKLLGQLDDPHYTTELARFNLEINLDPIPFGGNCFSAMENQLDTLLGRIRTIALKSNAEIILTGILPTLRKSDLGLNNMTPQTRYLALNEATSRLRGDDYELFLKGTDELHIKHDSVMLEACNTSFQVHFQVVPEEFARLYNIAQTLVAPILATSTNSPLLFGKRLWHETRIAVFQQSIDTRHPDHYIRESTPRVIFGNSWVKNSVMEIIREDIARFRILISSITEEDPFEALDRGCPPQLKALQLHNGTIYRWNRPCYGITNGKAHLRIENRILPSGPTVLDEVANAAFWFGLMKGFSKEYDDITKVISFDDVKGNFDASARQGLNAQFTWVDGKTIPAQDLILQRLLPLAREGLKEGNIDSTDSDRLLHVIESRVRLKQTGAQWMLRSFNDMKDKASMEEALSSLTAEMVVKQKEGKPVHEWPLARLDTSRKLKRHNCLRVEQYMTTDVFTVNQDDIIDLATCLMDWHDISHIPVEDVNRRLVGIVSIHSLHLLQKEGLYDTDLSSVPVSEIMQKEVPTVEPETHTLDAIRLMREQEVSCLPVIKNGQLVGIVTEYDFVAIAAQLGIGTECDFVAIAAQLLEQIIWE
ncbi:MAG: CBS domain-containing protein [Candidatus Brocadiaceae bacterium]|nr:CBS domain-containing protein [Candidatus Brocadiaceae bacterium]